MNISGLLSPSAVKVITGASSKKRLIQDIAEMASSCYGLHAGRTADALQERESLGPTGVGKGIALPHARIDKLPNVVGLFLRLERPMDYDSVDRLPVDLVFALLAPQDAGVDHLKALALVSRTLRDPSICQKLRSNADPVTLHAVLTETQAIQAA